MRFVLLFENDPIAAGSVLANGRASVEFLEQTIERFGASLIDVIPVVGRYDAVAVCDFPSHPTLLAFTMSANASGQQITALPAVTIDELDAARSVAENVAGQQLEDLQPVEPVPEA